jgi:hypothetical protein
MALSWSLDALEISLNFAASDVTLPMLAILVVRVEEFLQCIARR